MKTYHSIDICTQYFAWLGFRATERIFGGGSNSEDFFVLFAVYCLQSRQCSYRKKLLSLAKIIDFMKSISYPINLKSEPYYREHDIAFLLYEQRYHRTCNCLLDSVHLLNNLLLFVQTEILILGCQNLAHISGHVRSEFIHAHVN